MNSITPGIGGQRNHFGVEFQGSGGPVKVERERLLQFMTNIDIVMSLLERNGLGDWLADRLVALGESVQNNLPLRIDNKQDPFLDDRLRVQNLPLEPQTVHVTNPINGKEDVKIALFSKPGQWLVPAATPRSSSG